MPRWHSQRNVQLFTFPHILPPTLSLIIHRHYVDIFYKRVPQNVFHLSSVLRYYYELYLIIVISFRQVVDAQSITQPYMRITLMWLYLTKAILCPLMIQKNISLQEQPQMVKLKFLESQGQKNILFNRLSCNAQLIFN